MMINRHETWTNIDDFNPDNWTNVVCPIEARIYEAAIRSEPDDSVQDDNDFADLPKLLPFEDNHESKMKLTAGKSTKPETIQPGSSLVHMFSYIRKDSGKEYSDDDDDDGDECVDAGPSGEEKKDSQDYQEEIYDYLYRELETVDERLDHLESRMATNTREISKLQSRQVHRHEGPVEFQSQRIQNKYGILDDLIDKIEGLEVYTRQMDEDVVTTKVLLQAANQKIEKLEAELKEALAKQPLSSGSLEEQLAKSEKLQMEMYGKMREEFFKFTPSVGNRRLDDQHFF